jgi:hypothetical protein
MKAKQIKKLREQIIYYQSWIPIINKEFNTNATIRDIMESSLFQRYIIVQTDTQMVHENYKLLDYAFNRIRH